MFVVHVHRAGESGKEERFASQGTANHRAQTIADEYRGIGFRVDPVLNGYFVNGANVGIEVYTQIN